MGVQGDQMTWFKMFLNTLIGSKKGFGQKSEKQI